MVKNGILPLQFCFRDHLVKGANTLLSSFGALHFRFLNVVYSLSGRIQNNIKPEKASFYEIWRPKSSFAVFVCSVFSSVILLTGRKPNAALGLRHILFDMLVSAISEAFQTREDAAKHCSQCNSFSLGFHPFSFSSLLRLSFPGPITAIIYGNVRH